MGELGCRRVGSSRSEGFGQTGMGFAGNDGDIIFNQIFIFNDM